MLINSVKQAEKLVATEKRLGTDVRWDNYDVVFFREAENGMYSKQGAFRNGKWGFENRFKLNDDGVWDIDIRNLRSRKRSGR